MRVPDLLPVDLTVLAATFKEAVNALEKAVRLTLPVGQWCLYDRCAFRVRAASLARCSEELRRVRVVGYCVEPDEVQVSPPLLMFRDGKPLCVTTVPVAKLEPIPGEGLLPGDVVMVRHDLGDSKEHTVTSAPWRLWHGAWVVGLSGVSGGYDLTRVELLMVRPADDAAMHKEGC